MTEPNSLKVDYPNCKAHCLADLVKLGRYPGALPELVRRAEVSPLRPPHEICTMGQEMPTEAPESLNPDGEMVAEVKAIRERANDLNGMNRKEIEAQWGVRRDLVDAADNYLAALRASEKLPVLQKEYRVKLNSFQAMMGEAHAQELCFTPRGEGWIPVSERLPTLGDRVLCVVKGKGIMALDVDMARNRTEFILPMRDTTYIFTKKVTHWMPSPKLPRQP